MHWRFRGCLIIALALWTLAVSATERGILWRIEGAHAYPSYLLGTIHSEDSRVTSLPAPLKRILESVDSLGVEVIPDGAAADELAQAILLPAERDLHQLVGATTYRRSVAALAGRGYPEGVVLRLKPWAIATLLSTPPQVTGQVLDMVLYQHATTAGKRVYALESVAEQIAVFDGLKLDDQLALLRETLDCLDEIEAYFDQLHSAWLDRDLDALVAISEMARGDAALARRIEGPLIDARNERMVKRMIPRLRRGNTLIAVGALHLPGPRGILALLRQHGWRIAPVY